jgi:hypothetical protein
MSLFSRVVTAASLWVHLLAINLFSARTILQEGSPGYLLLQKFCMMCLQNGILLCHMHTWQAGLMNLPVVCSMQCMCVRSLIKVKLREQLLLHATAGMSRSACIRRTLQRPCCQA